MSMTTATSPSSGADRARRYRRRKSEGCVVATVEVGPGDLKALVDNMLLEPGELDDRAAISEAIEVLLFALAEGAAEIDFDRFIEAEAASA